MRLEEVVPWGRKAHEYRRMFDLSATDLAGRILGCGDGPASFNAEMTAAGHQVISVDPVYAFDADEIRARVAATYATIINQVKARPERYVWREFANADAHPRVCCVAIPGNGYGLGRSWRALRAGACGSL